MDDDKPKSIALFILIGALSLSGSYLISPFQEAIRPTQQYEVKQWQKQPPN